MTYVTGTTTIYEHCTFAWRERQTDGHRLISVEPDHCRRCVDELDKVTNCELVLPRSWPRGTRPPLESPRPDLEVLVIDGDDEGRRTTAALLTHEGFAVRTAAHGREARAVLAEMRGAPIVLLDLPLPVTDGGEVLRELRDDPRGARVPVVVLSGERILAKPPGCDFLLARPVPPVTLVAVVKLFGARARPFSPTRDRESPAPR